jgi:di/tricarboxylate transporter
MIVTNILSARSLKPLGFFSVSPFGLSVLAAGMAFILLRRGLLSEQPTAEVARTQAPRAYDLIDSYGLTSR